MNFRVGSTRIWLVLDAPLESSQTTLQQLLFSVYLCWENRADFLVQSPELIDAHRRQMLVFHFRLREDALLEHGVGDSMEQCGISLRWQLDKKRMTQFGRPSHEHASREAPEPHTKSTLTALLLPDFG